MNALTSLIPGGNGFGNGTCRLNTKRKEHMTQYKEPVYQESIDDIHMAIRENLSADGRRWYNTSFVRRSGQGDQSKGFSTFSRRDLPTVRILADIAHAWICQREIEDRNELGQS